MEQASRTSYNDRIARLFAADIVASSITSPSAGSADPRSYLGIVDMQSVEGLAYNALWLAFYGTGAADSTGTFRVTGLRQDSGDLWVPVPLVVGSLALGTKAYFGSEKWCDTITPDSAATQLDDSSFRVSAAADNEMGYLRLDGIGFRYVRVDLAKGTMTGLNAAYYRY